MGKAAQAPMPLAAWLGVPPHAMAGARKAPNLLAYILPCPEAVLDLKAPYEEVEPERA